MSVVNETTELNSEQGDLKVWTEPRLGTVEMRETQFGKSSDILECTGLTLGIDDPTDPLCDLFS